MGSLFKCIPSQVLSSGQDQRPPEQDYRNSAITDETTPEVWVRLQEYIKACPHHGIEEWLIIQNFFHGLNQQAQDHVDATAGGSFLLSRCCESEDVDRQDSFEPKLERRKAASPSQGRTSDRHSRYVSCQIGTSDEEAGISAPGG